jgi:hypothetical protein
MTGLGQSYRVIVERTFLCLIAVGSLTRVLAQERYIRSHVQHNRPKAVPISLSTPDRLADMPWWPTKGAPAREEYVGTKVCETCHRMKVATQALTEMAKASTRSSDPAVLDALPALTFRQGFFTYEIERQGDAVLASVADGDSSLARPLLFAFGKGIVGHTYIYRADGKFYESHVSYYSAIRGLDLTTGHLQSAVPSLEQALGRLLQPQEVQKCFGCHTTAATTSNHFEPAQSFAGVTCEACHQPGAKHVQAMMAGQIERGKRLIFNPARLDPAESVDFCGACHRTLGDVIQMDVTGVPTVRFQPFRLEESHCWIRSGGKLTCLTCHDPHKPLAQDASSYDHICLQCHSQPGDHKPQIHPILQCKVGRRECVNCHMPKVEIPGMHHAFVDHSIRIQKDVGYFPN